jgi:hypothetical protein
MKLMRSPFTEYHQGDFIPIVIGCIMLFLSAFSCSAFVFVLLRDRSPIGSRTDEFFRGSATLPAIRTYGSAAGAQRPLSSEQNCREQNILVGSLRHPLQP